LYPSESVVDVQPPELTSPPDTNNKRPESLAAAERWEIRRATTEKKA
jgi:hypothetical protein